MQISRLMRRFAASLAPLLLCLGAVSPAVHARTQDANVTPVVSFGTSTVTDKPAAQRGDMLLANDGNIYFVSSAGGKGLGAIGRLAPDGTLGVLYAFANSDEGVSSYASLIQGTDGNLYGTTFLGGTESGGVVFKVTLSGTYTVLRSFGQSKRDAVLPYAGLAQASDGNLYGTTLRGGAADKGTIFRISTTGDFAIIHEFAGGDGDNPEGTLIVGADGNLYGTTLQGGADGRGAVFKITTSGTYTLLYSFPSLGAFNSNGIATNTTGANPRAGLLLGADGNYYGTAYQGGANGYGTVFRMTPAGAVTVMHAFTGPSFGGAFPLGRVTQDAAGNFYGTTQLGGYVNKGTVWRIDTNGLFSMLHGMVDVGVDGSQLYASVLVTGNGLYGVSYSDLIAGSGYIFKIDTGTAGVLPIEISLSPTEITTGSSTTITWSSPGATVCAASGVWTGTTVTTSGTLSVTPASAGIYTYGLSCTDGAGVVRYGYTAVTVKAPPTEPVDGGGGAGAMTLPLLLLLAALLARKYFKEIPTACP
jgi:uncharacterized repeat protein (TIGR03803 family)